MNTIVPILSICIPTYNRKQYLKKGITSIVDQFVNYIWLTRNVEVIILDDKSTDGTEQMVQNYLKTYSNISYIRNQKNLGSFKSVMKVATYARGQYIWFFTDDDLQKPKALETVLNVLKKQKPDLVMANLDMCTLDAEALVDPNLLRVSKDQYFPSKKELFTFLESKFFLPIDWFLTSYSNMIIKKIIFDENNEKINSLYNKKHNMFPHTALIYYTPQDYSVYVIAKPIALYRTGNLSFGPKNKIDFLKFWYPVLKSHYAVICQANRQYISNKFRFLMMLKILVRDIRIVFLKIFNYDISVVLMKLFYR